MKSMSQIRLRGENMVKTRFFSQVCYNLGSRTMHTIYLKALCRLSIGQNRLMKKKIYSSKVPVMSYKQTDQQFQGNIQKLVWHYNYPGTQNCIYTILIMYRRFYVALVILLSGIHPVSGLTECFSLWYWPFLRLGGSENNDKKFWLVNLNLM